VHPVDAFDIGQDVSADRFQLYSVPHHGRDTRVSEKVDPILGSEWGGPTFTSDAFTPYFRLSFAKTS
jgi:hypothetical protein